MAKIAFTKLNLIKDTSVKILDWQNQKIEIKQFLSTKDKLDLISRVINLSVDDHVFYNPCKVKIFGEIEILLAYTNINLTEKQQEDILKLYDLILSSGFLSKVKELIPKEELKYLWNGISDTIHEIYRYRDSAMGVMEQIAQDYKDTSFDIRNIIKDMEDIKEKDSIAAKLD